MLDLKNVTVCIDDQVIVHKVSMTLEPGTVHIIMGPNGSGKSSLCLALMGHPRYKVVSGTITLGKEDITALSIHERARRGLFHVPQHQPAIPGLSVYSFLKECYGALTGKVLSTAEFQEKIEQALEVLGIDKVFIQRSLHDGFSGGEKKRLELLQLLLFRPAVMVLDEIDSGLDVDALGLIGRVYDVLKADNPALIVLMVTHYVRVLQAIQPTQVHILYKGSLVRSGGVALGYELEQRGYDELVRI